MDKTNQISMKRYYNLSDKRLREIVSSKYSKRCAYCGNELSDFFHIDHVEPLLRGVKNNYSDNRYKSELSNLNPSCPPCNSSKGSFSLEEWRVKLKLKYGQLQITSSDFRAMERFGLIKFIDTDIVFYFEKC